MADLLTKIKIKKQDGTFTDYIPIGAEAENINVDGESVENKLNKKPYYYNTVADMKADSKLKNGDMVITLGYYSVNDGGAGKYNIINGNYNEDGGSYHRLNNNLFAELIIDSETNSKQFGIVREEDVTIQLQKFFDFAYLHREQQFNFLEGHYYISNTININPYIKIRLKGTIRIGDRGENNIAFNIISYEGETTNSSQWLTQLFDNTNGTIRLDNLKQNIPKIGVCINSIPRENGSYRVSGNIRGLRIAAYDIGLSLNTFNTYLIDFHSIEIWGCRIGIYVGENGVVNNSGENISFNNCLMARNDCCIYFNTGIRCDFIQSSFDFNSCLLYIPRDRLSTSVKFHRCWIEGVGQKNQDNNDNTYFNGFSGFIYSEDDNLWYNRHYIDFSYCTICHLKGLYQDYTMKGSALVINMQNNDFWYGEDVFLKETIGENAFKGLFLSDSIRNITMKNNTFRGGQHPMINKNLSLTDALLEGETVDENYSTLGNISNNYFNNYEIVDIGTTSTKIRKVIINDKKCIELTPPYNGASSWISLRSKPYFLIKDIYKFYINGALKGYKGQNHSFISFKISFYDKDLNEISIIQAGSNNREDTYVDTENFMFSPRFNDKFSNSIPNNAVYFKIQYDLNALRGSFSDTQIKEVTVTATDPVYFTGFYSFIE